MHTKNSTAISYSGDSLKTLIGAIGSTLKFEMRNNRVAAVLGLNFMTYQIKAFSLI